MVYIYDSSTGKLIVCQLGFGMVTEEEMVEHVAKEAGMSRDNLSWGSVKHLEIDITDEVN